MTALKSFCRSDSARKTELYSVDSLATSVTEESAISPVSTLLPEGVGPSVVGVVVAGVVTLGVDTGVVVGVVTTASVGVVTDVLVGVVVMATCELSFGVLSEAAVELSAGSVVWLVVVVGLSLPQLHAAKRASESISTNTRHSFFIKASFLAAKSGVVK